MKRIGNLYEKVISFKNLYKAFTKAKRGTKNTESLKFFYNLENELFTLYQELSTKIYKPVKYRYFKIYEPKEREISVASFRDRIVHHAIINILEPIYENIFIYDSYATRKEKGTHRAIKRAQEYLKKNKWYLKADIKKYFESINPDILMQILQTKIKDKDLLLLIEVIIRNSGEKKSGLPIGNLTSQFFANVYLDKFDHYIKDDTQSITSILEGNINYFDTYNLRNDIIQKGILS